MSLCLGQFLDWKRSVRSRRQIRYLHVLCDLIVEGPGELSMPEIHIKLTEQRLASYRRDSTDLRPHNVLKRLGQEESMIEDAF